MGITTKQTNKATGFAAIQVTGMNETLREIRKFDLDLFKRIRKNIESVGRPLADEVGKAFPKQPLKFWKSSMRGLKHGKRSGNRFPPYNASSARKGVKAIAGTGLVRAKGTAILRLQQMNGGAQIYDSAGSESTSQFVKNLDKHSRVKSKAGRFRSRVLFPQTKKNAPLIEAGVKDIVRTLERETDKRLTRGLVKVKD